MASRAHAGSLALALLACAAPVHAVDDWVEVRSPHFVVVSNAGDKAARRVAAQFEQVRGAFTAVLPTARLDPGRPIIVFAARDADSFWELLPERDSEEQRKRLGGLYARGSEQDFILLRLDLRGDQPRHAVYHEYTHAILRLNFEWLPLWLNEGLAEFFSGIEVDSDRVVIGTRLQQHLDLLQVRSPLPLETLLSVDFESPHYTEGSTVGLFYAQSWAMVHYFVLHDRGGHWRELLEYVSALTQGLEPFEAAQRAFGDVGAFARTMAQYARRDRFYSMTLRTPLARAPDDFDRRELPDAEVAALRGTFQLQTGQLLAARASFDAALARDPMSVAALAGRGELAWRDGDLEDARDWLQQAVETGQADARTYLLHGRLLLQSEDQGAAGMAVRSLQRAVDRRPELPSAHSALARALVRSGEQLDAALGHIRRAIELEPGAMEHRQALVVMLAGADRRSEALVEARVGLRTAGSEEERQRMRALLEGLGGAQNASSVPLYVPAEAGMARNCADGDVASCVDLGRAVLARGDRAKAARFLGEACSAGDPTGCTELATLHCEDPAGLPVENDPGWGCYELGSRLLGGGDPQRAAARFEQACDEDFLPGCSRLADLLETGNGVPADPARAAQLFRTSCEAEDAWACTRLGKLYEAGTGVEQNLVAAAAQYERACSAEDAWGCAHLGSAYERGAGVHKDPRRARELYVASCDAGFEGACDLLRKLDARLPTLAE